MKKPFARQEVFTRIERLLDFNRAPRRIRKSDIMEDSGQAQDDAQA